MSRDIAPGVDEKQPQGIWDPKKREKTIALRELRALRLKLERHLIPRGASETME